MFKRYNPSIKLNCAAHGDVYVQSDFVETLIFSFPGNDLIEQMKFTCPVDTRTEIQNLGRFSLETSANLLKTGMEFKMIEMPSRKLPATNSDFESDVLDFIIDLNTIPDEEFELPIK